MTLQEAEARQTLGALLVRYTPSDLALVVHPEGGVEALLLAADLEALRAAPSEAARRCTWQPGEAECTPPE